MCRRHQHLSGKFELTKKVLEGLRITSKVLEGLKFYDKSARKTDKSIWKIKNAKKGPTKNKLICRLKRHTKLTNVVEVKAEIKKKMKLDNIIWQK